MPDFKTALIIGMDKYTGANLPDSIVNAREVTRLLRVNEDESPNFAVNLVENVPTKAGLKKLIIDLFASDVNIALLYFSGQGFTSNETDHLVALDFEQNNPGVSVDEILNLANRSRAKNRIVIFDCCFSGNPLAKLEHEEPALKKGMTILAASTDCRAEDEIKKHGVFSRLLIEALKGGASDVLGRITPGSLYAYIDKALGAWGERPVFKTNVTQFISLRTALPQIPAAIVRKLCQYFSSPDQEYSLNPSYEDTNTKEKEQPPIEPYADQKNVTVFKDLQKLQSIGLVVPVGAPFMFFAAMESKTCKLTPLGQHYWRLVKQNII